MSAWTFDKNLARKALARIIVVDEMPFSVVEREGFKNLMNVIMFKLLSRWTVRKDCLSFNADKKKRVENFL